MLQSREIVRAVALVPAKGIPIPTLKAVATMFLSILIEYPPDNKNIILIKSN